MEAWLAYAPVKNNPEDAAKVQLYIYSLSMHWVTILELKQFVKPSKFPIII